MNTIEQLKAARDAARLLYENAEHALAAQEEAEKQKTDGKALLDSHLPLQIIDGHWCNKNGKEFTPYSLGAVAFDAIRAEIAHRINYFNGLENTLKQIAEGKSTMPDYMAQLALKAARRTIPNESQ